MISCLAGVSDWWVEVSSTKICHLLRGKDLGENMSPVWSNGSEVLVEI